MQRKEQIEALAQAWEALGDIYGAYESYLGDPDDCDLGYMFQKGGHVVASIVLYAGSRADTEDATPCLAILRDAKGEDWDIQSYTDEDGVRRWEPHPLSLQAQEDSFLDRKMIVSTVSRIDSVRLAIEAKQ